MSKETKEASEGEAVQHPAQEEEEMKALERIKEIEKTSTPEEIGFYEDGVWTWINEKKFLLRAFQVMRDMYQESVVMEHGEQNGRIRKWCDEDFEERMSNAKM